MISLQTRIKDRGSTPRGMRKVMRAFQKNAWFETAFHFHATMVSARFTHKHAAAAGYRERSKQYTRRKFRIYRHTYPLVFTGRTERRVKAEPNITSTSNGGRVAYRGANTLNFGARPGMPPMVEEFVKILPREADELARRFDESLDQGLNHYNSVNN